MATSPVFGDPDHTACVARSEQPPPTFVRCGREARRPGRTGRFPPTQCSAVTAKYARAILDHPALQQLPGQEMESDV